MKHSSPIYVAGYRTLLGYHLTQALRRHRFRNVVAESGPDLADASSTNAFFAEFGPEYVFMAEGLSGGIGFNLQHPATLMQNNLVCLSNVLHAAHCKNNIRLLYLASSCMYPRDAAQPMAVDMLGTGPLEPTSAPYATAKVTGLVLCESYRREFGCDFITVIPANTFGPGDDFSEEAGHVIPAMIARVHKAKSQDDPEVVVWGSGKPVRDFLYAADAADAVLFLMRKYSDVRPINIGSGTGVSVAELAYLIAEVVGYRGKLRFDTSRPDGQPVKILDSAPLARLGWKPKTPLRTALEETYNWFLQPSAGERDVSLPRYGERGVSIPR
ncbi:MAG: GDP-L-fucose synthase [Planctomycetia bacterium]|nr:GDP-L-fucose synthase [Planctomycetia bacterium]